MKKLLFIITLLCTVNVAYAACQVYFYSYTLNNKTYQCECITCGKVTECTCR